MIDYFAPATQTAVEDRPAVTSSRKGVPQRKKAVYGLTIDENIVIRATSGTTLIEGEHGVGYLDFWGDLILPNSASELLGDITAVFRNSTEHFIHIDVSHSLVLSNDPYVRFGFEVNAPNLQGMFLFRNETKLRELLRQNPKLHSLLLDAHALSTKYFLDAANLILEIVSDPESPDEDDSLFLVLRTGLDVEGAMGRLYALEAEWLSTQNEGRAILTFDLEFV